MYKFRFTNEIKSIWQLFLIPPMCVWVTCLLLQWLVACMHRAGLVVPQLSADWLGGTWGFVLFWRGRGSAERRLIRTCAPARPAIVQWAREAKGLKRWISAKPFSGLLQTSHPSGFFPEWRRSVPFGPSEAVMKRCAASRSRASPSPVARAPQRSCPTWMTATPNWKSWYPASLRTSQWAKWRFFSML